MVKKILVAGAGGFIGGHLVARLRERGDCEIRAVDIKPFDQWHQYFDDVESLCLDLRERPCCEKVVVGVDEIYNLAADMGGIGFIEGNKFACMVNVLINTNLLLTANEVGVERFFFSSSACVYRGDLQNSDQTNFALKESDAYPADPEDGYGWEKLFSERMCRHAMEDCGLITRVARFHNSYGSHGTWSGGREKAPAAICRKVAFASISGNHSIEIWGDGTQKRSFMYIDDNIEGMLRIMYSDISEPINLGSAEMVTINEMVSIAEDIAGIKLSRRYRADAPIGVAGRSSDNSMILERLNWEPSTSLYDGLAKTYEWIYDQVLGSVAKNSRIETAYGVSRLYAK